MVEEERGLIGTYKALGYGKATIALKYVIYAFLASLTGAVIGCAAGLRLFPYIIYESWNIIYQMPAIKYASHTILSVVAVASLILVTLIATFIQIPIRVVLSYMLTKYMGISGVAVGMGIGWIFMASYEGYLYMRYRNRRRELNGVHI